MKLHPFFYFFIFFIFVSKNLISQIIIVDSSLRILEDNTLFINPIYNSKKSFEEELKKKFKKELRKVSYLGCNITLYKYKYPSKITFTSRIGQRESIAFKDLKRKVKAYILRNCTWKIPIFKKGVNRKIFIQNFVYYILKDF